MKTKKVITREEMADAYNEQYYTIVFKKKSATLFLNTNIRTLTANFSVFALTPFKETQFDNMADAADFYNNL